MDVMRFYGWSFEGVMTLPYSAFWVCHRQMGRLRAQENLNALRMEAVLNAKDENFRREFVTEQLDTIGKVITTKPNPNAQREAIAELKSLA